MSSEMIKLTGGVTGKVVALKARRILFLRTTEGGGSMIQWEAAEAHVDAVEVAEDVETVVNMIERSFR